MTRLVHPYFAAPGDEPHTCDDTRADLMEPPVPSNAIRLQMSSVVFPAASLQMSVPGANDMPSQSAQRMALVGQLTAGIVHDFGNLLTIIIGSAQVLMGRLAHQPDQHELAVEILEAARNGMDLTTSLLAVARSSATEAARLDINPHIAGQCTLLRRLLGEAVRLSVHLAPELWPCTADAGELKGALLNLVINARNAIGAGGAVSIDTENRHVDDSTEGLSDEPGPGDYVVLTVADTGTGMSPELVKRCAEPFFTTNPTGGGTGLGLAMVHRFASRSNGHLVIRSTVSVGTRVEIYLPRAVGAIGRDIRLDTTRAEALPPPQGGEAFPPQGGESFPPQGGESILLVDDNQGVRTAAARHLGALGYEVTEAADGPAALSLLRSSQRFDLLLTDVVMPGEMSGFQLVAQAQALLPGIAVLITTGFAPPSADMNGAATHLVLHKPYLRQQLAEQIRAALAMAASMIDGTN